MISLAYLFEIDSETVMQSAKKLAINQSQSDIPPLEKFKKAQDLYRYGKDLHMPRESEEELQKLKKQFRGEREANFEKIQQTHHSGPKS